MAAPIEMISQRITRNAAGLSVGFMRSLESGFQSAEVDQDKSRARLVAPNGVRVSWHTSGDGQREFQITPNGGPRFMQRLRALDRFLTIASERCKAARLHVYPKTHWY